jgi:serine/threonine protein kinase
MKPTVPPPPTRRQYHRIGRYEIASHIATGGMGVVYRAFDAEAGREVALKILSPTMATKPIALERFRREASHGTKLRHENLVAIYELGEANDVYYLALEYVEGIDLHEYIARTEALDPDEALELLTQAARALDYLHKQQVVHRDIKPANFMITLKDDRVVLKLTDLGLAREVSDEEFRVTRDGNTVGTIDYMAPEQARNSGVADIRSDIYSLGCTLYHMLAGHPPFAEGGLTERLYQHAEAEPEDVRQFNPNVAPGLVRILGRMLRKKPEDRYQTPEELLNDLSQLEHGRVEGAVGPAGDGDRGSSAKGERPKPADLPELPEWCAEDSQLTLKPEPEKAPSTGSVQFHPDAAALRLCTRDQVRAAAGQFERAQQALARDNMDYGIHLLLSCCKFDPGNLIYRQTLRHCEGLKFKNKRPSSVFGWARTVLLKARLRSARRAREYRTVLELGEEVLTRSPAEVGVQIEMAEAADRLGLARVAIWILEHAWQKNTRTPSLSRALARLYEKHASYTKAAALWKMLLKVNPTDPEAHRKASALAAKETIARGRYEQTLQARGKEQAS